MLKTIFITILYLWAFWAFYVLVMGIYRAYLAKRLRGLLIVMALPLVAVGAIVDVVANMTIATVVFLDLPHELLVTTRMQRYIAKRQGWRAKLSAWICDHLLDIFDPTGNHC